MSSGTEKMFEDLTNLPLFIKKYKQLISSRDAIKRTFDNLQKDVDQQLLIIIKMLNYHEIPIEGKL